MYHRRNNGTNKNNINLKIYKMGNLALETQGIKGTKIQKTSSIGSTQTFLRHEQDYIFIDDFTGFGDSYKQRELTKIEIVENGKILFSGDKYELFKILKENENKI